MNNVNNLFILNLTVTLRCTLKCKLCVADVVKYETSPHFELDFLTNIIDKAFDVVDYAERFQLSGGEPLMHKDIHEVVKKAVQYKNKFGMLGIFSNGTIVPSDELIRVINENQKDVHFKFYLSHYGNYSNRINEIEKILIENGIDYEIKTYHGSNQHFDGWIDYGEYERFNYDEVHVSSLFENCGVHQMGGIWSLRFGELHRCTRSASGISLGKIPRDTSDYLDLLDDLSIEEQRLKLQLLIEKKYIQACFHCKGDFGTKDKTKRFPAAEQV